MIINSITLVLILILLSCSNESKLSANEITRIETEVNTAFNELVKSAKTLNVDEYMKHFDSGKFTGITGHGTTYKSIDEFKHIYHHGINAIESYNSLEFPVVKITVLNKSTAILVNEYKTSVKLKSGSDYTGGGAGTQVWSKDTGEWKLVSVSGSDK